MTSLEEILQTPLDSETVFVTVEVTVLWRFDFGLRIALSM